MTQEKFSLVESSSFKGVVIDAAKNPDDTYSALFNFFTQFGDEVTFQPAEGFAWLTQLSGDTLLELYAKVDVLVDLGLFDGIRVSAEGILYDVDGTEIGPVDWNSFTGEDARIALDMISGRVPTLH